MYDLTGFQRDLLYVSEGLDEPHGLAIKDELDSYYESEIYHGRLYPNLDTLVDKGLLEKGEADRRTNVYSVTLWGENSSGDVTTSTDEFDVDITFGDKRSVIYVHDDAVDNDSIGPDISSEEIESGFFSLSTVTSLWSDDDDETEYMHTLDQEQGHDANATHYIYLDGDGADSYDASAEGAESADILIEQTTLAHNDVAVVFNKEMDSDHIGDNDTYGVYDSSNGVVTLYTSEDLYDR